MNDGPRALEIVEAVLGAGVRVLQYRAKEGIDEPRLRAIREAASDAVLFLNDDWRSAKRHGCDGVHLGPGDDGFDDPRAVRAAWPEGLIGISCANEEEARAAESRGADYIGAGSVYATSSKTDAGAPIGIEGLRAVVAATRLPVVAIGGIGAANLADVHRAGAAMAATISAVSESADPRKAARSLVRIWEST